MSPRETADLTRCMTMSGDIANLSDVPGTSVDKHSTGGVGDKVSIVLAPLVASFGLVVPMMSGRGLGHTGGTLDKLESIPGFNCDLSMGEFKDVLRKVNVAMISPAGDMAPVDKRIYALRDVTSTVRAIPLQVSTAETHMITRDTAFKIPPPTNTRCQLLPNPKTCLPHIHVRRRHAFKHHQTASIMCKKLAENPQSLVLDVKSGLGSFNPTVSESLELAKSMVEAGESYGKRTTAFITRMDEPIGKAVGNWLEVMESVDTLKGEGPQDLVKLCEVQGGQMLVQGGLAANLREGIEKVRGNISNGKALEKFYEMVEAQGGSANAIRSRESYGEATFCADVVAGRGGVVTGIDALMVGEAGVDLGAGRRYVEDGVDFKAGILLEKKCGDVVEEGDVLAKVYTNLEGAVPEGQGKVERAFSISADGEYQEKPLITHIVTGGGSVEDFDQSLLH